MAGLFGAKLRALREARGLSGNALAKKSQILQGTLSGIEHGKRPPSRANLEALAAVAELGVSLDELQAWADLDQIGVDGLSRIAAHISEVPPAFLALAEAAAQGGAVAQEAHPAGSPSTQNHGNHDGIMVSGFVASRKPASRHGFQAISGVNSATGEGIQVPDGHIDLSGPTVSLPVFGPRAHAGSLSEGLVGATDTLVISALLAAGADAAILVAPDGLPGLGAGPAGMVDYLLVRWPSHQRPVSRYPVVMRQGDQYVYRTYVEDELGVYLEEHQPHATPRRHRYDPTDLVGVVVARYQHWPLPAPQPEPQPTTRPLTPKEKALVKQLQAVAPLEDLDLGPGSYVWALPAGERLAALKGALEDLGEGGVEVRGSGA